MFFIYALIMIMIIIIMMLYDYYYYAVGLRDHMFLSVAPRVERNHRLRQEQLMPILDDNLTNNNVYIYIYIYIEILHDNSNNSTNTE